MRYSAKWDWTILVVIGCLFVVWFFIHNQVLWYLMLGLIIVRFLLRITAKWCERRGSDSDSGK